MLLTSVKEQFSHFRTGAKVHFRRFAVELPISVKAENGRTWHHCKSSNVSTRGIYFDFPETVEVGCRLEMLLTIPGEVTKGKPILVRLFATAVRVDPVFSANGHVGIAAAIEQFDFGDEPLPLDDSPLVQEAAPEETATVEERLSVGEARVAERLAVAETPAIEEAPAVVGVMPALSEIRQGRLRPAEPPPVQQVQTVAQKHRPAAQEQTQEQAKVRRFRVTLADASSDVRKVDQLFAAFVKAKRAARENTDNMSSDTFKRFVHKKTTQLRQDFGCQQVEYVIEVARGQVKLKAKAVRLIAEEPFENPAALRRNSLAIQRASTVSSPLEVVETQLRYLPSILKKQIGNRGADWFVYKGFHAQKNWPSFRMPDFAVACAARRRADQRAGDDACPAKYPRNPNGERPGGGRQSGRTRVDRGHGRLELPSKRPR